MFDWHRWLTGNNPKGRTKRQPSSRKSPRRTARLQLENLEVREMLANDVPRIVSVIPANNSNLASPPANIVIRYSELMTASAANPANYLLLDSANNRIVINTATATTVGGAT